MTIRVRLSKKSCQLLVTQLRRRNIPRLKVALNSHGAINLMYEAARLANMGQSLPSSHNQPGHNNKALAQLPFTSYGTIRIGPEPSQTPIKVIDPSGSRRYEFRRDRYNTMLPASSRSAARTGQQRRASTSALRSADGVPRRMLWPICAIIASMLSALLVLSWLILTLRR